MALFNNGEVYHWGYGGHGQSGDASTSNRSYPARCGGTYQEVFLAANTSTHTLRDTRIKRIYITVYCESIVRRCTTKVFGVDRMWW